MMKSPSDEQASILAAFARRENILIRALAGTGKSSTIALCAPEDSIILCFGRKTKQDMEKKLKAAQKRARVLTLNGLGHIAFRNGIRKGVEVEPDKVFRLAKDAGHEWRDLPFIMGLARAARSAGIIPQEKYGRGLLPDDDQSWASLCESELIEEEYIQPARKLLTAIYSASVRGVVDFDDQVYMSAFSFASFPKAPYIIIDEAQDLSPANHAQLRRFAPSLPLAAVGDENQAIFAWRGAHNNSMTLLKELRTSWTELPLTLSYRCPKVICDRYHALSLRAASTNLVGSIQRLNSWSPASGAILCRNNAPLIRIAFRLLASGTPINLLSRDVATSMKRLLRKVGSDTLSLRDFARKQPHRSDECECLIAILEYTSDIDEAMTFLSSPKSEAITLSTIHRAKGLEWDTVYHLNPWLIPSKMILELPPSSLREALLAQEKNLRYVAETRTRDALKIVSELELQA